MLKRSIRREGKGGCWSGADRTATATPPAEATPGILARTRLQQLTLNILVAVSLSTVLLSSVI